MNKIGNVCYARNIPERNICALISAVESCCEIRVEFLISSRASVNKYNPDGYKDLMEEAE